MIIRMLKYLNEGNDFSDKAMQLNLELSEFMVQHYKEQLIRGEYIRKVEGLDCHTACGSCTSKCSLAGTMDNQVIMWEITDKGLNVIEKNEGKVIG